MANYMKVDSTFCEIVRYFNTKNANKIFTRREYFTAMDYRDPRTKETYLDTVRCYLVRAGYLETVQAGVYRKRKKIPQNLTITALQREAYPKAKRYA